MRRLIKESEMIEEAKKAKYLFHFVFVSLVVYVIMLLGTLTSRFMSSMVFFFHQVEKNSNFYAKLDYVLIFKEYRVISIFGGVFAIVFALLFVLKVEKRSLSSLGIKKKNALRDYFIGFIIGTGLMSLVVATLYLGNLIWGYEFISYQGSIKSGIPFAITLMVGFLITGATFEIVFRGFAFISISATYNILLGIVVNALMYAVVRYNYFNLEIMGTSGYETQVSTIGTINVFLIGIFLSIYVLKSKNLFGAMAISASWLIMQVSFLGLNVGGMEQRNYSFFYFNLKGKDYLTGGNYGLEGSIIVTGILVVAIGFISLIAFKQDNNKLIKEK